MLMLTIVTIYAIMITGSFFVSCYRINQLEEKIKTLEFDKFIDYKGD